MIKAFCSLITYKIMQLFRFISAVVLIGFSLCVTGQDYWKTYKSDDGTFSILLPCKAETGNKHILTDIGSLETKTIMCQPPSDHPNKLYLVNYVDYPPGSFHPDSVSTIGELFDISIAQHIHDLGGELLYQSEHSFGKHPGRLYRASCNKGNTFVKSVIYLIGDRFYSLQVYAMLDKSLNNDMDIFLNSLRILKQ